MQILFKLLTILPFLCLPFHIFAQNQIRQNYKFAFFELQKMAKSNSVNIKNAVFVTENAYFDNDLDSNVYNKSITKLVELIEAVSNSRELLYNGTDKEDIQKLGSIFTIMTDSIPLQIDSLIIAYHLPFIYDFNDIWGEKEWSNMFVTKLLATRKGNCHSLPFLYKILAEELGVEAHLALAPNHIYIKTKSEKFGWYNTELTSGMFPIDAWIMASGYIHLNAIQNQLYMSALDDKQSIAICMTDLAEGYARKTEFSDPDFIIMCCDTALSYFPNYVNAMLLKIKTRKYQFETELQKDEPNKELADEYFNEMQTLASTLHQLGYRQMPKEMYLDWLISLKLEQDKYTNKQIMNDK